MSSQGDTATMKTDELDSSNGNASLYSHRADGFHDLDDATQFENLVETVQDPARSNFVVDFSDHASFVALDYSLYHLTALFDAGCSQTLNTRWLHIYRPFQQRDVLQYLAKRYDFSPRLLALMCSDPRGAGSGRAAHAQTQLHRRWFWQRPKPTDSHVETGRKLDEFAEHSSMSSVDSVTGGNLYRIVNNIWHYSSIDFGRSYICLGYNSLFGNKASGINQSDGLLPHCTRIWSWLLLCDDNTIISIQEDPIPFKDGTLSTQQLRVLAETRRNLVNVFRSLSTVGEDSILSQNPMTVLPIRLRLGNTVAETAHRESDAPGLLFYYLFENWHNSYTLVTRRESRYGVELDRLRADMFRKPRLEHVDRLDRVGRELGVLKRHYASYDRLIVRLLEPQQATAASLQNSRVVAEADGDGESGGAAASQTSLATVRLMVTERETMLGVSLSSPARVRFKRLRDLINLYAVSEVDEYLKQKDALVAMNFNLIAIKQSVDVERLTRVTLLLTKATILFLPVSLMTAYFSVQLDGINYTAVQYWVSFVVMLALSWAALFVFGVLSGSVQTGEVYRSVKVGLHRFRSGLMHK